MESNIAAQPVLKAILKTPKTGSTRFDTIAAQCLGQAETKKCRGQKREVIERLPLQSDGSYSSDFNPLISPVSKTGKFDHEIFEEHVNQ